MDKNWNYDSDMCVYVPVCLYISVYAYIFEVLMKNGNNWGLLRDYCGRCLEF